MAAAVQIDMRVHLTRVMRLRLGPRRHVGRQIILRVLILHVSNKPAPVKPRGCDANMV